MLFHRVSIGEKAFVACCCKTSRVVLGRGYQGRLKLASQSLSIRKSLGHSGSSNRQEPPTCQEEVSIDMEARPITDRTPGTVLLEKQTRGETSVI